MKRLHWYDHLYINLFWLGLNIRNTAVGSIFMPYLVNAFADPAIKNTALGAMRFAGLVVAMLVQPAAGLLSDRSLSRFGRRRPFLVVGVLLDLVFLAAIAMAGGYWALLVAVMLIQITSNISHGPLQALIPDLVPEDQRSRSSALKAVFELLPLVLVSFSIAPLVASGRLSLAVALTGLALFVTMILTVLLVKEEPLRTAPTVAWQAPMLRVLGVLVGILLGALVGLVGGGLVGGLLWLVIKPLAGLLAARLIAISVGGLISMLLAVVVGVWAGARATLGEGARQHARFTWWVVNRLCFLAAATSIQGFAPFFLMSAFQVSSETAIEMTAKLTMVVGIFTLVSAMAGGWLGDRLGTLRLVNLSGWVAVSGSLVLLSTTLIPNLPLMYVAGSIIGLATGLFLTTNWSLGTSLTPPGEAGRYLGISNLAGAGAGMVGAGLGGPIADLINKYQSGLGYFVIFACYTVLFVASSVSLLGVRGITIHATAPKLEQT